MAPAFVSTFLTALLLAAPPSAAAAKAPAATAARPRASIREERRVVVGGVTERWRLEWVGKTVEACPPDREWSEEWGTCPCAGFEFAEAGELHLVRLRPGAPEERLPLAPFFSPFETPEPKAVLPRWPVRKGDREASERKGFAAAVRTRPLLSVMLLGDYDHDGQATEFLLQVGAGPCGHRQTIVVGVDASSPRLHAFASAESPGEPLVLEGPEQWERFRRSGGEATLTLVGCGDHGSDEERTVRLRAGKGGIHSTETVRACP
jgi:hypothetical protein